MGFFPVDEETCLYLQATGRTDDQVEAVRNYYKAQGMFGIPKAGECQYSTVLNLDLASISPGVAGPKRPQDRIELSKLKDQFNQLMLKPVIDGGYGKTEEELWTRYHEAFTELEREEKARDTPGQATQRDRIAADPQQEQRAAIEDVEHERLHRAPAFQRLRRA